VILPMVLTGAVAGAAWLRSRQDPSLELALADGSPAEDVAGVPTEIDSEPLSPSVADLVDEVSSDD